jgi:TfoX/Sxy family transcriptional regulator of competence genes
MFGEYALYCDEKVVGFICDDQLFIKITPEGKKLLGTDYQEAPAYPGSKPYVVIDGSMLENEARFCELITTTAALVPAKKLKKR